MTIVFFSNFLNHHQALLSDELYKITNKNYYFVALSEMPDSFKRNGYPDYDDRPYLLKAYEDERNWQKAQELAVDADVALFGASSLHFEIIRAQAGKFSFEVGERWLKRGWINLFSPRLLKNLWYYHSKGWSKKPLYKLCSSAYCAGDQYLLQSFKGRCYKWGYFTKVEKEYDNKARDIDTSSLEQLMWCARFLKWKHPEFPVKLAARLKAKGYHFMLDMYGSGEEYENIVALINKLGVNDCVHLCGNLPNDEILNEMRRHNIFLFTSDRNEGWGAVLNEAMANGCVPVAADAIGSVPFLVQDGENGMIFKSENLDSLEEKVLVLLNNRPRVIEMATAAVETMNLWSPHVAAERLIQLIQVLHNGKCTPYEYGPCSIALPMV